MPKFLTYCGDDDIMNMKKEGFIICVEYFHIVVPINSKTK